MEDRRRQTCTAWRIKYKECEGASIIINDILVHSQLRVNTQPLPGYMHNYISPGKLTPNPTRQHIIQ